MSQEVFKRESILISAFACEPGRGSEQEVGWRWAVEMSRWYDVTVITQSRNKPGIDAYLDGSNHCRDSLRFVYHQLPQPFYRLKSKFDILTWPYYFVWQITMIKLALKLHGESPFALAHHVTFVSFRVPVYLRYLGVPVVFGPVGGADKAPIRLLARGFGPIVLIKELVRNATTAICSSLLKFWKPLGSAGGVCLAATPSMQAIFTASKFETKVFPAVGIDANPSPKLRRAEPTAVLKLLFVGRLHPLKGVTLLLEALAVSNLRDFRLTVVGDGRDLSRLRDLSRTLGIGDRVDWVGKMRRELLPEVYRRHDILVAPSLYESGGLTALEAMAQGIPVVALDVGGHSVSIGPECGIRISPSGSFASVVQRLADALLFYRNHPHLILTHGENARRRISGLYAWPIKANEMRTVYERLIDKRS
jgi:glycosyltransferase involved in cell wall biosynthesis